MSERKKELEKEPAGGTEVISRPESETKLPKFYKVLILNDDFTPRDYVVHILQKFFQKDEPEATRLMLEVHHKGMGVAGLYTLEIAETKSYQVNEYSRQHQYPLKCTIEKE
jgi:ATP-dependent Clp protease adaptor protein ClpS